MPIYGYRCQSCQREFEVQKRMSDPPQEACPDCSGPGTRLFYPAGILFKGSGFYKTDSRATTAAPSSTSATTPATDGAASTPPAVPAKSSTAPAPAPGTKSAPSTSSPAAPAAAD